MRCVVPSGIVTQRESGGIIDSVKFWTTKLANCLDNENMAKENFITWTENFRWYWAWNPAYKEQNWKSDAFY